MLFNNASETLNLRFVVRTYLQYVNLYHSVWRTSSTFHFVDNNVVCKALHSFFVF
ncbi:hypothetical protein BgiMline_032286, partial [Biomphalaria glabrata]